MYIQFIITGGVAEQPDKPGAVSHVSSTLDDGERRGCAANEPWVCRRCAVDGPPVDRRHPHNMYCL